MAAAQLVDGRGILVVSRNQRLNFLSPIHLLEFKVGDVSFKCLEQYIHYHKAQHFGDLDTAKKILEVNTVMVYWQSLLRKKTTQRSWLVRVALY